MTEEKQTLKETLQLIVNILSFDFTEVNLQDQLKNQVTDWDAIVVVASKHLVLTTVYCRLQQKSLLHYLPQELNTYLKELTQLNRDRNQTLLGEAKQISKLLNDHHIPYVFLKGIALLAGHYYKDLGERMIGDIDILVGSADLDKAFDVLVAAGYSKFISFNYEVKNYRHRPRQISEAHLGAIELHGEILKHEYRYLLNKNSVLMDAKKVNGLTIPKPEDLIYNTILAQQINDLSYYYNVLQLKALYDSMVVGLSLKKELIAKLSEQKYSLNFLNLASIYSPDLVPTKETVSSRFHKWLYLEAIKTPKLGKFLYRLKYRFMGLQERLELLAFNGSYRKHIIKNKLIK